MIDLTWKNGSLTEPLRRKKLNDVLNCIDDKNPDLDTHHGRVTPL
jgi:hypothetical protein